MEKTTPVQDSQSLTQVLVKVCVPHTRRDYFDYHYCGSLLTAGIRVRVPFRNQIRIGIVLDSRETLPQFETKAIESVLDETPLLSEELISLCRWVGAYYQSPLSEVLPLALPKKYREGANRQCLATDVYKLHLPIEEALTKIPANASKQRQLIDFLSQQREPTSKQALLNQGASISQIKTLLSKEVIEHQKKTILPIAPTLHQQAPLPLNPTQQTAVNTITNHLQEFKCFLLQGVTGSGKTEVYLQTIEQVLKKGLQVLVLVPEIGLTPQLLSRFRARFKETMAVIHSNLNDTERQQAWQLAYDGIARLIIGTRTAIFTPMPQLGMIVIDEEHDASLKQMDGVRYSARDTALIRAQKKNIPIVLGSATPSLESLSNCLSNKYQRLLLPERARATTPLEYKILDIRNKPLQHGIAQTTLDSIQQHLAQQNQVMVFINRRGFAPVLLCHHCGWMADCKACDSHLTFHQSINKLICHHCGLVQAKPPVCKACQSHELVPVGAGTQRIHEYLSQVFPETNITRVDRDVIRRKHALEECLTSISQGESQIIVGTQMLAKGHHFPRLTLVVILDADNGFYNQDFRALERLGQLITQVAGRAGREDRPGQVLIQTHVPHHPLLNQLVQEGYEPFAETLLAQRAAAHLPPTHFMAMIRAQSKKLPSVLDFLHRVKNQLNQQGVITLGPAPAPLARKAEYYRMQLLVKSASRKRLQVTLTELRSWLTMKNISKNVRWGIDVDPMDLS